MLYIRRKRLKNKTFSLIASNCIGGVVLHDLGLPFNTPFINLWIEPKDFIKLVNNLEEYMKYDMRFITQNGVNYPIGLLKDVKIYFQHYKSNEEAKRKWELRKKRINYDNIYVFFTDRDGCTQEDLIEFESIKYPKKVFTNKPYKSIKSAQYIKGFENMQSVGMLIDFIPKKKWKRYIDQFDYVRFFNKNYKR